MLNMITQKGTLISNHSHISIPGERCCSMPRQGSVISAPVTSRCSCSTKQMKCSTGADRDTSATTRTSILFEENKGFRRWYLYINCVQSTVLYAVCLTWSHMFFFAGHDDVFYSDYVVPYGSHGVMLTNWHINAFASLFSAFELGPGPWNMLANRKLQLYRRGRFASLLHSDSCSLGT